MAIRPNAPPLLRAYRQVAKTAEPAGGEATEMLRDARTLKKQDVSKFYLLLNKLEAEWASQRQKRAERRLAREAAKGQKLAEDGGSAKALEAAKEFLARLGAKHG